MVEYRTLERFPGYRFGSDGSMWSRHNGRHGMSERWRRVQGHLRKRDGYIMVCPRSPGEPKPAGYLLHRLVLEAFRGPCPPGHEACHNNGVRHDNRITNLRWGTPADNTADKWAHGTMTFGELSPRAAFTNHQANRIRERLAAGETAATLAQEFGVTATCIRRIRTHKRYSLAGCAS
jgi:hypothetical protein